MDPFIKTDNPASYKAAGHRLRNFSWLQLEHKASTLALNSTHCSRDKHLARPHKHINKKKSKEPHMPGLLTEKWECKQIVSVTERRAIRAMKISKHLPCVIVEFLYHGVKSKFLYLLWHIFCKCLCTVSFNRVELVLKFWKKCCWYVKVLSEDTKVRIRYLPENKMTLSASHSSTFTRICM
jgi:hypothetical protein